MKTEAIGSGPYLVSEFRANDSITLKANPNYWGEHRAKTETVVVRYFTDDNAAVNALASGDVQVLAPISENLAGQFADDPDHYTVQAGDGTEQIRAGLQRRRRTHRRFAHPAGHPVRHRP